MKKFLACLLSGVFVLSAFAQKVPTMRPISEKKIHVRIAPLEKRGKWGYADEKEHFLIRPVFDHAEPFQTVRLVEEDTLQLARVTFENRFTSISPNSPASRPFSATTAHTASSPATAPCWPTVSS